jgi:hypothetical protein
MKNPLAPASEAQLQYLLDLVESRQGSTESVDTLTMLMGSLDIRGYIPKAMASQAIDALTKIRPTAPKETSGRS